MASASADPALKSARLSKLFNAIIYRKRAIKNANDAKLFLEATCHQEDRSSCVEKLVAAPQGLQAIKTSLRIEVSSTFVNEYSADFLRYIIDDSVRLLCRGQLFRDILRVVVDPPTFWKALEKYYVERSLSQRGIYAYASLLLDLLCSPPPSVQADVFETAEKNLRGLLESPDGEVRGLAYKIQDLVRNKAFGGPGIGTFKPGGRHDNDFEDFREIALYPTADELLAKDPPFYLQAEAVLQAEPEKRAAAYLDNQFRLLREDILAELRNDLQIALGNKRGRRTSLRLKQLSLDSIDCGIERRRKPAAIALRCYEGLPKLVEKNEHQRRKFYAENKTILKHNSFGCLLRSNNIVAFANVDRNDELLAKEVPIILLQVLGSSTTTKVLVMLKTAPPNELEFVLVDTPVFAYEPILKCLQDMPSLPLARELLNVEHDRHVSRLVTVPEQVVTKIHEYEGQDLRYALNFPKKVVLDSSQTASLIAGLTRNVSLIQGPPGIPFVTFCTNSALPLSKLSRNGKILCWDTSDEGPA